MKLSSARNLTQLELESATDDSLDLEKVFGEMSRLEDARLQYYGRTERYLSHASVRDMARARAYLAKIPPAVEGNRGRAGLWRAVCIAVRDFGLHPANAIPLIAEWNRHNAPPFSLREVEVTCWRAHRREGNFRSKD